MSTRVWLWLFSLSALWGGTFFFAKVALGELPPFTVVFARVALAAAALNVALLATSGGLIGPDLLDRTVTGVWGQFACLSASLCYAFAGIYGRRFRSLGIGPMEAAAGQVTA